MALAGSHFITRACSATEKSMMRYRIGPATLLNLSVMLGIVARWWCSEQLRNISHRRAMLRIRRDRTSTASLCGIKAGKNWNTSQTNGRLPWAIIVGSLSYDNRGMQIM